MIKARLKLADGTPLVVLGLSGENLTRMMADEPIMFSLSEVGLGRGRLVIVAGRTEETITKDLEEAGIIPKGTGERIRQQGEVVQP